MNNIFKISIDQEVRSPRRLVVLTCDHEVLVPDKPQVGAILKLDVIGEIKIVEVSTVRDMDGSDFLVLVDPWDGTEEDADVHIADLCRGHWFEGCRHGLDVFRTGEQSPNDDRLFVDNPNPHGGRSTYDGDKIDLGWMKRCIQRRWQEGSFEDAQLFAEFVQDHIGEAAHTKSSEVEIAEQWSRRQGDDGLEICHDVRLKVDFTARSSDTHRHRFGFDVLLQHVRFMVEDAPVRSAPLSGNVELPQPPWAKKTRGANESASTSPVALPTIP